jgi:ABC-type glycerol-3-phosphate transport system permease component
MLVSSFKPLSEIFNSSLIIKNPTFDNYVRALESLPILKMIINTFIIAFSEAVLQLFTAILASYALTRWHFKGSGIIMAILSLTWLIPIQAIMIPNYVTISSMGLRNTILGVILPNIVSVFAILSIYTSFKSFPRVLVEAAVMDGLSEKSILFRIILPNIKASLISIGILLFISGWNEYIWAMMVNSNLDQAPIQIGLQSFMNIETYDDNSWGILMAASTLSCLPILAIYLVMQKQIINSFVKGGIK